MKLKRFLLYLITFLVYTQGFLERFTPLPASGMIEVGVWVLMLVSFRPKSGLVWMIIIFLSGLIAAIGTNTIIPYFKYLRYFFYFYVVYTALWNLHFTKTEFGRYIRFNVTMVLLQGIASIINLTFFGRAEYNVGAMSSLGGTTATVFPLFIFTVLLVVYYFSSFPRKSWHLYILLMIASVFLMAYSSGKRAIFFYIPSFLIIISIICLFSIKRNRAGRKLVYVAGLVVLFLPVFFWGITQAGGIGDSLSGNEDKTKVIRVAFEYAMFYEDSETSTGATTGRSNTTEVVVSQALASWEGWLKGNGFGTMKDEDEITQAGVGYGFVGFSKDVFSGGIIFASLVVAFFIFIIFHQNVKTKDGFSRIMRIAILLVFVVVHFTYSSNFTSSLKINMMLAPLLCFLNSVNYSHLKNYYYSKYLIRSCLKMDKKELYRRKKLYKWTRHQRQQEDKRPEGTALDRHPRDHDLNRLLENHA